MSARTIAIVEDDPDQLRNCADALESFGYRTEGYGSRAEALRGFDRRLPDLAVLDIMLGEDRDGGYELCRELVRRRPDLPVIFLSALDDVVSQVAGLKLGAWDYQTKPVSFRYLGEKNATLFRIHDRDPAAAPAAPIRVGSLSVDEEAVEARWKGTPLPLTLTEFRILAALARHPGRVATYEFLMESTLEAVVTRNTINTHVTRLRRKLREADTGFASIRNEYGLGYRWVE